MALRLLIHQPRRDSSAYTPTARSAPPSIVSPALRNRRYPGGLTRLRSYMDRLPVRVIALGYHQTPADQDVRRSDLRPARFRDRQERAHVIGQVGKAHA